MRQKPGCGSYLGLAEVLGHDVCAHFVPLDNVASVLCMATHGSRSVALVEAAANILGCELEVAVFAHAEDLCRPHDAKRSSEMRLEIFDSKLHRRAAWIDNRWVEREL